MAATGHMHGATKLCYRMVAGDQMKAADWEKFQQSINIFVCMAIGAVLGAAALHHNPLGEVVGYDRHDFLLVPVALTLAIALTAHDATIVPAGGWPVAPSAKLEALKEPLAPRGAGTV